MAEGCDVPLCHIPVSYTHLTWNGVSRFDGRDFETFQFDSLLNQHMQRLENTACLLYTSRCV